MHNYYYVTIRKWGKTLYTDISKSGTLDDCISFVQKNKDSKIIYCSINNNPHGEFCDADAFVNVLPQIESKAQTKEDMLKLARQWRLDGKPRKVGL